MFWTLNVGWNRGCLSFRAAICALPALLPCGDNCRREMTAPIRRTGWSHDFSRRYDERRIEPSERGVFVGKRTSLTVEVIPCRNYFFYSSRLYHAPSSLLLNKIRKQRLNHTGEVVGLESCAATGSVIESRLHQGKHVCTAAIRRSHRGLVCYLGWHVYKMWLRSSRAVATCAYLPSKQTHNGGERSRVVKFGGALVCRSCHRTWKIYRLSNPL